MFDVYVAAATASSPPAPTMLARIVVEVRGIGQCDCASTADCFFFATFGNVIYICIILLRRMIF